MRYKIGKGIIIKSENAAKPENQSSSYLNSMISKLPSVNSSFDYGCGKLRYANMMSKTTQTLALVDSEIQLSRSQVIRGKVTSIRTSLQRSNHISAFSVSEFARLPPTFDRGFCLNVLSVIPSAIVRLRIVQLMRSKLRPGSSCLFVTLYRNSDFTRMRAEPNARSWDNGFLMDSLRGHSFYGLIPPDQLALLVRRAGFEVESQKLHEGTVYLWAKVPPETRRAPEFAIIETQEDFRIVVK